MLGSFDFSLIHIKHTGVDRDYEFYGSYYRGMLGRNLKKRFCILKNTSCEVCPLNDKCLYMLSFEKYKDTLFLPYIINRSTKDELHITLIGSVPKFSEIYIDAYQKELKIKKAGYYNPFNASLEQENLILNSKQFENVSNKETFNVEINYARFKRDSMTLNCDNIVFNDIIKSVERRIYLVNKFYGKEDEPIYIDSKFNAKILDCSFHSITRYSNRKKRLMSIPSIKLVFLVENSDNLYKYFYLASFLNIGTNASMGFGQINVY